MKANRVLKVIAIISGILTVAHIVTAAGIYLLSYIVSNDFRNIGNTSAVGIIGSADGPTAIYVSSGNTGYLTYISFAACLIANIISIVLLVKKRK